MCVILADREHDIGEHYVEVFKAGLSSLCLHPFLDTLNMSLAEVQVLIASARHELGDLKYRPYLGL